MRFVSSPSFRFGLIFLPEGAPLNLITTAAHRLRIFF